MTTLNASQKVNFGELFSTDFLAECSDAKEEDVLPAERMEIVGEEQ